ncbi:MAG TPA: 4-hydroxy-tetrahydrodipicolinate reductase [Prolixibacteraceae bacterium]|nr:4-hydroxy-tetrahydrodipicolinate reductase [Prolixibacteraceae bacterium]
MRIALIGYGRMGKEIEKIAIGRKHGISLVIDVDNLHEFTSGNLQQTDVAVVFTDPESAVESYRKCFASGIPVVSGTTGWLDRWDEVVSLCTAHKSAFFYASNFSLGMNIFFEMNRRLSSLMAPFEQYKPEMTEVHHIHKVDAPSGTAITLAEDLMRAHGHTGQWVNHKTDEPGQLGIVSIREGEVPGIHTIRWSSDVDFIEMTHSANNRKGLALGAVLAAEYVAGKNGIFSMRDLMNLK